MYTRNTARAVCPRGPYEPIYVHIIIKQQARKTNNTYMHGLLDMIFDT